MTPETPDPDEVLRQSFRQAYIRDQIQDALFVPEGQDPDDPERQLALVSAVNSAADLSQEIGDAGGAESNLKWVIQLCRAQLDRPQPRFQFREPLARAHHNLALVQWQLGRAEEAEASFGAAMAELTELRKVEPDRPEHGVSFLGSMANIAILKIEQARFSDARRTIDRLNAEADRLVDQHPDSPECRTEQARYRELDRQFRKHESASAAPNQAPDSQKPFSGCAVWIAVLVVGGFFRLTLREGQRPQAPPARNFAQEAARADEMIKSALTTIEYVNDSPRACVVGVFGNTGSRKRRVAERLPAGPGQSVQQSTFTFSVTEIVVQADGESVRTEVDFFLPQGGLSEIRIAPDLTATWKKLKDKHPPSNHGVLPTDE
ncbi:MAG TPA: tetratricopeptide repeat protein [Caulifigura sp.]|nr:tetratricopeptide repeat protein [Caulifigura sp.]